MNADASQRAESDEGTAPRIRELHAGEASPSRLQEATQPFVECLEERTILRSLRLLRRLKALLYFTESK
eukprot:CAMPEP_0204175032 /NCGR_PEP_ID=MMETSP0361-20130328/46401_1 /ASSEMBLY_ACC=CAM_ASM_000343 /TAXON_ID=268821 /ORGANISM="Scrippsiella Hangoei, Strain SHTV-5" /LENGTH=68 /DNA_ID=CAMNT_0051133613 /DNA_START=90 /DNA_END=293 /DNA_ORIENTATION=+